MRMTESGKQKCTEEAQAIGADARSSGILEGGCGQKVHLGV